MATSTRWSGAARKYASWSDGGSHARRRFRLRPHRAADRSWDDRVAVVDALAGTPGFQRLRTELITLADLRREDRVLDVGAGTGLLTLAAAPRVQHVTAIDVSAPMCATLRERVSEAQLTNVEVRVADAAALPLPDASVDVVLSNYCLHHLPHERKLVAVQEVARVLRPGGRLVLGDMMFEIRLDDARDRAVLVRFVLAQLRRGPAGILRLARNAVRLLTGRSEHPASVKWWAGTLADAGFVEVRSWALEHEGGIAIGRRPAEAVPVR